MTSIGNIKKVGVAGAGTMGLGIAQLCAMAGYETVLYDLEDQQLKKAEKTIHKNMEIGLEKGKLTGEDREKALNNLSYSTNINALVCDILIEAIVEKLDIKHDLFSKLEEINSSSTVFASNTSSIPITQIGSVLKQPERLAGMHFFNPAHIMKLVEVVSGAQTDENIAQILYDFAKKLGKQPVMAKDSPGFIVNRVARHYYVESLKLLEEGVADHETIDNILESCGFRMGPFRLMDLIGVDTNFSVTETMYNQFYQDPKFRPSRIQKQKVDAGHHGRKSGKGFYDYS